MGTQRQIAKQANETALNNAQYLFDQATRAAHDAYIQHMAEIDSTAEELEKQLATETDRQARLREAFLTKQAGLQADIIKATAKGKMSNTASPIPPGTPTGAATGSVATQVMLSNLLDNPSWINTHAREAAISPALFAHILGIVKREAGPRANQDENLATALKNDLRAETQKQQRFTDNQLRKIRSMQQQTEKGATAGIRSNAGSSNEQNAHGRPPRIAPGAKADPEHDASVVHAKLDEMADEIPGASLQVSSSEEETSAAKTRVTSLDAVTAGAGTDTVRKDRYRRRSRTPVAEDGGHVAAPGTPASAAPGTPASAAPASPGGLATPLFGVAPISPA